MALARRRGTEPSDTQDWISERFRGKPAPKKLQRSQDRQDLRRIPEAKDFRRDNPNADIHDWEKYQKQGGRWQGKP